MVNDNTFPNILSPDVDKNSKEFGLKLMRSTYDQWRGGLGGESASDRKNRFDYNRAFSTGQQPMEEYKDILDLDGDLSVINLSYDPSPIAIPFIARLIDRYMRRIEKIQCNAIDPLSQNKREKAKADAVFKLKEKADIQEIQGQAGITLEEFSDDEPDSEKELEIQFGFTYKQREEVIMEQGIDLVFYDNDWTGVIKKRILTDLINCGISQVKPYINSNGLIKIRFTKPEFIVSTYTDWDDFRDAQIQGEVYNLSISDIRMGYPGKVSEKKLWELAFSQKGLNGNSAEFGWGWNESYTDAIARPYDSFRVTVMEIDLKTLYNLKYESSTDRYGKERLDRREGPKTEGKKYVEADPYEVDYKGIWIVETEILLEWGVAKNQIKPENKLAEVKLPWITFMYNNEKMTNKPFIETMIPSIKIMQLVALQQQKIIASAAPDGFKVDISTMSDITLGDGLTQLSPFQVYKIYKQTGVQFYKRIADSEAEGNFRNEPIEPMNVPFSGKLEQLMNMWNQEYDKLQKIIGTNDLDSGDISNQAAGKSVLQEARNIGESASNYIYDAYLNMTQRCARLVQCQLWDILVFGKKFGKAFYDGYRQALGEDRVEYIKIEATDDFEKRNFDVKVQAVVDEQEAIYLENNIQGALVNQQITLQDAIDVRLIAKSNIKYASYMLASRDKKRRKEQMEEARLNSQDNTQAAVAAAQAKSQGEIALGTHKSQLANENRTNELEYEREIEAIKYFGIAKAKIIDKILSKEGSTLADLPAFLTEGMDLVTKTQTEMIANSQQEMLEQQALEEEQLAQEQMEMEQQNAQMAAEMVDPNMVPQ